MAQNGSNICEDQSKRLGRSTSWDIQQAMFLIGTGLWPTARHDWGLGFTNKPKWNVKWSWMILYQHVCVLLFSYMAQTCVTQWPIPVSEWSAGKKDLKIILCGDSAVGKSKMVERFLLETLVAAMGEKKGMHTDTDMHLESHTYMIRISDWWFRLWFLP